MKKGGISVQTENIFPVIKRWLYSDKDIFLRELVSNACDAITRHKRLASLSEAKESVEPYVINVTINKELKTVTISDNGVGMTEEEVDKYINNMAISGALEFISKYESDDSKGGGIIGHFGLGFYSAFMVADNVEMETKSYTDGGAVHWDCVESGEYEMTASDKETRGTEICLHINENELEYLDYARIKSILNKYCAYMPYEIYCIEGDKKERVNASEPIWQKAATEVKEEDYNEQYKSMFSDYRDPLFSVHINADYPLNFKGVLFFPAQRGNFEPSEGVIKLFYNSVFVADNIKGIVPDYLSCLSGALDCPELPLNVSRSYLQDDSYVRKLSAYIVKKIADKLCKLKNDAFDKYTKLWSVISPYIEYGCIKDVKFYERAKNAVLLKNTDGSYVSLDAVLEGDEDKRIYYTTDEQAQSYYVSLFTAKNIPVYLLDTVVDSQFTSFIESKNDKVKFLRVDSSTDDLGSAAEEDDKLIKLFANAASKDKEMVSFAALGEDSAPALIKLSEEGRRMADMMRMYSMVNGGAASIPTEEELVINTDSSIVKKLSELKKDKAVIVAKHIYYNAIVSNRGLSKDELSDMLANNKKMYDFI